MNRADVYAAFESARREIFRLEVQQSYAGVTDPDWDSWKAGKGLAPVTPESQAWYDKIAARATAGVRQQRVLVVDEPLDPYLHYEMAAFRRGNLAAGEQIMVARRSQHPELTSLREDFWMFDEQLVAVMTYDAEHRPLGPREPTRPVSEYVAERDIALAHAFPLDQWMNDHQALLRA